MKRKTVLRAAAFAALAGTIQAAPGLAEVQQQVLTVHSPSIEGNLQGNSPHREVVVFLPEGYDADADRRYPLVVLLHGFGGDAKGFAEFAGITQAMIANRAEMIVAVPDVGSVFGGSILANSPTTGNYEGFVAHDLIRYLDRHYRTLAQRESRGIAGSSMRACGALKLALKHADTFSAVYAMSPTCVTLLPDTRERLATASSLSADQVAEASFAIRAMYALASAWSPAPDRPPFFLEWPEDEGDALSPVWARWAANLPLAMVPQYTGALSSLRGLAIDVGNADPGIDLVAKMDAELTRFSIDHQYEIYDGGHSDRVPQRVHDAALPFFAERLAAEMARAAEAAAAR